MNDHPSSESTDRNTIRLADTKDTSHTLFSEQFGVTYHSIHGAVTESEHVFIRAGLGHYIHSHPGLHQLSVFEMGFGSGLNALLTYLFGLSEKLPIAYCGVEQYPLSMETVGQLNYPQILGLSPGQVSVFHRMHAENTFSLTTPCRFSFQKMICSIADCTPDQKFDVVFYDAFAPDAQPELWTDSIFSRLFGQMSAGGILVTYCAKGDVRRAMLSAGFSVERIPGPPGKREMIRATKLPV